jgi:hypothetical protein
MPMTHHKLFLIATLFLTVPVFARDSTAIRGALARENYGLALSLTKREFANVRSGREAANLIRSVIAYAPAEQIPPLVTVAVEANPQFGREIISGAIEGASNDEATAILTSAYFALSRNPNTPPTLLSYISDLRSGTVPIYEVLTMPWFNPGNSIGTLGSRRSR